MFRTVSNSGKCVCAGEGGRGIGAEMHTCEKFAITCIPHYLIDILDVY